ncbi:D-alanyl-D-alanine carboxypeptidase family protein [Paenibacillus sp. NEAU-GSW1]|uniref:D-alanyl-D-alanine carboxypeptidase family protein n=1 Tax=Paenibacillus sp. NEAU-GSW1 TaxID=2682486 RepID=UPI0012E2F314|nr:D-alanyl-D-alanine carboxypeptidase family protein [Paenibacillus sp. NEAU-GSW1]MUT67950.1 D-alanyl-D-alanine carboxypeptidase [Paenibacillus sp. NEAU-GSW1]
MLKAKISPPKLRSVAIALMAVWLAVFSVGGAVSAAGTPGGEWVDNSLGLEVSAAILIDADSGQVIYEVNADAPRPPASMTKLMTEFIVLEEITKKSLSWDQIVTVSEEAASTPQDGSQIYLAQGDQHSVKDLYIAMAVGSANDATVALASHIGGSEAGFVDKMNETAKELGLTTAHFTSATGLLDTTVISARDMSKLAQTILAKHPEFLEYSNIVEYKFRPRDDKAMTNWNWMLGDYKNNEFVKAYAYDGVDGMKTGYISAAGYTFTGTVKRGDTRYISVVMNTKSKEARFNETAKLYNYAFNTFEKKSVVAAKSVVESVKTVKIKKGVKRSVPVVTESDITFTVKKGVEPKIELAGSTVMTENELVAPIKAGQKVGTVTYKYTDDQGKALEKTINLIASEEVKKAGWFKLMFRSIGSFFSNLFNGIIDLF